MFGLKIFVQLLPPWFGNTFHPYFGHEFLWETRSTSNMRHCSYHRYYIQPMSEQPMQLRQLCVGGSTDLLGQSNLDVCRSFDTLVTGRPLAALYLPSLCLTDKLTHVLLFRTIDVALSAHSVR